MAPFVLRPYRADDRTGAFRLAADTAFFGEPVEHYLDDRRLFCDVFCRYYTDLETDHSWVACADEEMVGLLMGCVDTLAQRRRWVRTILPGTLRRVLSGAYRLGPMTYRYMSGLAGAVTRNEFARCSLKQYPAHLHLNIDGRWRRQGLGRSLLQTYLDQLRGIGVPGVHLHTTDLNEAACSLYRRMGFRVVDARNTRLWSRFIDREVVNLCFARSLD